MSNNASLGSLLLAFAVTFLVVSAMGRLHISASSTNISIGSRPHDNISIKSAFLAADINVPDLDLKHRVILLKAPAFRDVMGTNEFRQYSGFKSVGQRREEFEANSAKEHDSLLEDMREKLRKSHTTTTKQISRTSGDRGFIKVQDYFEVVRGFSAILNDEEEKIIQESPQVLSISEDKLFKLKATRASSFLGLDNPKIGVWKNSTGANIVLGIIDSGIWPESASFSDTGLPSVPITFKGNCVSGTDSTFKCNRKLVGARFFGADFAASSGKPLETVVRECGDYNSPRDSDGHGTAMASIAASATASVSFNGKSAGTIKGIAFNARVAVYKVFWCGGYGRTADILGAINAAVKDGVDVLSLSLGSTPATGGSYVEPFAYALYKAAIAGVPPVLAAGNDGPSGYTLSNGAPWMMTVGAGTLDRRFLGQLVLGNGIIYKGSSFYSSGTPFDSSKKFQILYSLITGEKAAGATDSDFAKYCAPGSLSPQKAKGKIIVCHVMTVSPIAMAKEIFRVGGVGMVYSIGSVAEEDISLFVEQLGVPSLLVERERLEGILKYMEIKTNPQAYIKPTEILLGKSQVEAPEVAFFSSAGPNGGAESILKPDVIAPGYNIIVANTRSKYAPNRNPWTVGSGTSPACPFVAGTVALLKAKYPKWTSSMYFSAIITTATTFNNNNIKIQANKLRANPYQMGSGHVNPNAAIDPGLVYALPSANPYKEFLCSSESFITNYPSSFDPVEFCDYGTSPLAVKARDLNLPSAVFTRIFQQTEERTSRLMKNVGPTEKYTAQVWSPKGVKIIVAPKALTFAVGQSRTYTISVNTSGPTASLVDSELVTNEAKTSFTWWSFGSITWVGDKGHRVRIVVAVNSV